MSESTGSTGDKRPPRLDPLAIRRLLKTEGLKARHSLSQNFLADPDVLQAILDLAAPAPGDRVLEVGPGLGVLTGGLLEAGALVTAVELDRRLAERLRDRHAVEIEAGRLRLVEGDMLDQDIPTLMTPPYSVVANVPYHITSPILHRFLGAAAGAARPERMVLMLQREVAERIAAAPGEMSYLSVFVQYYAEVRIAFVVPREAFEPEPEVESAVVEIRIRSGEMPGRDARAGAAAAGGATETAAAATAGAARVAAEARIAADVDQDLWHLVQAGFRERRKKLHNVLSRQLPVPGDIVTGALEAAGIDGDRRPQTLSVDDWLALREALGPLPGAVTRGLAAGSGDTSTRGSVDEGGSAGAGPQPVRPGARTTGKAARKAGAAARSGKVAKSARPGRPSR